MKKHMKKYLFILILLGLAVSCADEKNNNKTAPDTIRSIPIGPVFLIIGQSNASSLAVYEDYQHSENIFVLDSAGDWSPANPSLNKYTNVPPRASMYYGYSFGYPFALKYLDEYGGLIKIISNARGGSSIDFQRKQGLTKTFERIEPYKKDIAGILFHQGEKDWQNPDWIKHAVWVVNKYREFLGQDVPFIFGELCDDRYYSRCVGFDEFNDNMQQLYSYLDNIHIVDSNGLPIGTDIVTDVHFSKEGQKLFGIRYFNAYQNIN